MLACILYTLACVCAPYIQFACPSCSPACRFNSPASPTRSFTCPCQVKELFRHYSSQSLGELQSQQDEDDMLQGVDWMMVEEQINVNEKLDVALPGEEVGAATAIGE